MNTIPVNKDFVGVVEDDPIVREIICAMLESLGIAVQGYAGGQEFLEDQEALRRCRCLVLDVRLPGMSGLELQRRLMQLEHPPAIIFVTGHGDISMAVEAMRGGAVDFLQKPFREQQLLDTVQSSLRLAQRSKPALGRNDVTAARLACLTAREHEVLERVLHGLRTKEVAADLGIATKTAEEHRANLMRKMRAKTIAELIGMCGSIRSTSAEKVGRPAPGYPAAF